MFFSRRLALLTLVGLLLVGGCGASPGQEGVSATPATPALPTAAPTPTPAVTPARNDLARGSVKRALSAGNVRLAATYFSTLPMAAWTPEASKPVTISVSGSLANRSRQEIFLSRLTMTVDVAGADGPLPAPTPVVDEASVAPGYVISAPSSYSQVLTLPALDPDAESVTVNLSYELLVQTAPRSNRYAKQAVSDTLVIALGT